jgi:hypothetical protein
MCRAGTHFSFPCHWNAHLFGEKARLQPSEKSQIVPLGSWVLNEALLWLYSQPHLWVSAKPHYHPIGCKADNVVASGWDHVCFCTDYSLPKCTPCLSWCRPWALSFFRGAVCLELVFPNFSPPGCVEPDSVRPVGVRGWAYCSWKLLSQAFLTLGAKDISVLGHMTPLQGSLFENPWTKSHRWYMAELGFRPGFVWSQYRHPSLLSSLCSWGA